VVFRRMGNSLVVCALALFSILPLTAQELDARIDDLEREVQELRQALDAAKQGDPDQERLTEIERRIEILAGELDSLRIGEAAIKADESVHGLGPAASKVYRVDKGVSIGGYGEMLYQNFSSTLEDGTANGKIDELDYLRAVVYFGYKFNDKFLFNSEIEFEHASTDKEGSASVEFAYVDYLWKKPINVRAGLLLMPMGFINELHEPTVFLGARRPETETRIIPTTWREGGIGIFGDLGPFSYRTYVVNGLDASKFTAAGLRGGRQKGSKAKAEEFAWTGRVDYVGRPGLLVGLSGYYGNSGQGLSDANGTIDVPTGIFEGHLDWRWKGLQVRLLATRATLDDVARLNDALMLTGDQSIGETMLGGYVQLGYDVFTWVQGKSQLTPYIRWESLNTQDSVPSGFSANPATDTEIRTFGIEYKPLTQLVLKVDYQDLQNEARTGYSQFNVGMGYVF
jgi:hypothetical protein